ncbi:vacuolar import/degradation [Striga asiatica]|uniref:Vacuolar import/degradation n=1 Tax=Striga asiatica TaxID=4170 RepID=A0A5A7QAJ3_STRAF|nr:vacuolar import/degradation [Striga asiatica]
MGGSQSREGLELSDSEYSSDGEEEEQQEAKYADAEDRTPEASAETLDDLDSRLRALKLKYQKSPATASRKPNAGIGNAVKLFLHIGGNTPKAKWVVSEKLSSYGFVKMLKIDGEEEYDEDELGRGEGFWVLKVGRKIRARVSTDLQMKFFGDQRRVDFVDGGVWALKFFSDGDYRSFVTKFQDCLFENVYGLKPTEENKVKIYGKDFLGWVKPEDSDDSMWEDADAGEWRSPDKARSMEFSDRENQDLLKEFEEAAVGGGIQSLALGALDNSFLVSDSGVQVVKNFSHGIHGKGVYVKFDDQKLGSSSSGTAKKALLMRGETNMMLMSTLKEGKLQSPGLLQMDIETGKIITDWKFEKDGADITMKDITSDAKGSQLDPSESTFLGLDDNRLCQWDMRDKKGMVQKMASTSGSPVLHWTQGHQFSRGTNFQCFATAGDGSIVVGSLDGKIRLYSRTSMRQAKTAFPGLGSPITSVDVTYDGKWVLGTTDTYLILICTLFTDKDGKTKTGFEGRMGNKIPAPRLLKLTPVDAHLAGADNKFHAGHFSWVTESGKQEKHLVATVGKFSVIWNFHQVKNSAHHCYQNQQGLKSCYCYKIVLKDESIIESRFMHDKFALHNSPEAPLVVATPMKVTSFSMSGGKR